MRVIHGERVNGVGVDPQTRCEHWHSELDIIAIKFRCCARWFPCVDCHAEIAGHAAEVWLTEKFDEKAILCGACGYQLGIAEYLASGSVCPECGSAFNPGCANHHHLYFEANS